MTSFVWLVIVCACVTQVGVTFGFRVYGNPDETPPFNSALDTEWQEYMTAFNKTYSMDVEQRYRRYVWEDNVAIINRHNEAASLGKYTYWMGVNQFTDMTADEFSSKMLSGFQSFTKYADQSNVTDDVWATLPSSVDWRDKNMVTPVKNQGQCGSCWAFSTVGSIEGQHAKKTGKLVSLSEQNLVDCADATWGNYGCEGGHMINAFNYVKANGGIDTEACYPYTAVQGPCKYSSGCIGAKVTGYTRVSPGEASLQSSSAGVGPISVAIMATANLQNYRSGVFIDSTCNSYNLNHAVLVVGYTPTYWIVKNSWGTAWGMSGYVQFARNHGNMCGIATDASYPNV